MFTQLKLYLYGAVGLLVAGLYAMLKYKSARLEAASKKLEDKKAELKAKTFEAKMKDNKIEAQQPPPDYEVEPGKYSLAILPLLFVMVGCADKQTTCPKLETLDTVKPIQFTVTEEGCVCGSEDLSNLFRGVRQLRKSEKFYLQEVNSYNEEFANER